MYATSMKSSDLTDAAPTRREILYKIRVIRIAIGPQAGAMLHRFADEAWHPRNARESFEIRITVQMAEENMSWGYRRIQGALATLGHKVSRSTVRWILKEQGIDPAPERSRRMPRSKFLKAHWEAIAAADFFTVEIWARTGLRRYFVFFVMDLATRNVEVAGITAFPSGVWMTQIARNLTDVAIGFLSDHRYLICDRDPLYAREFRETLRAAGVTPVRLSPRSLDLNAYAERFVRPIESECLDRLIIIGERHLRTAISEYVEHYHAERNHQGLENALIAPRLEVGELSGPVLRRVRLGGMLSYYHRKAA